MKKYKRKIITVIVVVLLIEFVHLFLYINYGLNKSATYIDEFAINAVGYTIQEKGYYLQLIPYDDLSLVYKIAIDEDDFISVDDDESCLEIYNIIIEHTPSQKASSFYSTFSMKKGECYEELIVDDVRYSVTHNIDVKTNYFTFKPYISKWMITIEEIT